MELNRSRWDELNRVIQKRKWSPEDFALGSIGGQSVGSTDWQVPVIRYRDGEYLFAIYGHVSAGLSGTPTGRYTVVARPGREVREDYAEGLVWEQVKASLEQWLDNLKAEVESPDLWGQLAASREELSLSDHRDNTPFSPAELRRLHSDLNALREAIDREGLRREQRERAHGDIEYLDRRAREGTGRFDWRGLFVQTVVGWVMSAIPFPKEAVGHVLRSFGPFIKAILKGDLPLIGP